MADPVSWAIAALAAGAELAAVESEKATLEGQARVKDVGASAAEQEAGMKEEMLRSQQQRQFGELRASAEEEGLSSNVTFTDLYRQSATKAEIDALMMGYSGRVQGSAIRQEAKLLRAAKPTGAQRLLRVAAAGAAGYAAGGGSFGGGGGTSGLNPRSWIMSGP
jgi:hypothetical protein